VHRSQETLNRPDDAPAAGSFQFPALRRLHWTKGCGGHYSAPTRPKIVALSL
jgi:hypothetical protein